MEGLSELIHGVTRNPKRQKTKKPTSDRGDERWMDGLSKRNG